MADLSILIPSRNEMFLARTIEDILSNIEGNTEIIAVLDGAWADPRVKDDARVSIIYNPESVGQRGATNQAARLSKAKYVMKCDAHCAFDKGFDVKMIKEIHDDWTMVPLMRNLHAFDWICPDGHRRYQGPSGPCTARLQDNRKCGKETIKDIVWHAKESPRSVSYCFDSAPHFQYFGEFAKRPEGQGEITETMSLQGSCFMLTRQKYWELNICDEAFGSWGSQGIEVAAKTWLSGGRVMVNKKTWYAHMFRTQGGDFSFPYPISGKDQKKAQEFARDLFFNNKWSKQIHPVSWLVERFWPIKGWSQEDLQKLKNNTFRFSQAAQKNSKKEDVEPAISELQTDKSTETLPNIKFELNSVPSTKTKKYQEYGDDFGKLENTPTQTVIYSNGPTKGIIFYTDNRLKLKIAHAVQNQLRRISSDLEIPIVSASLKPMPHFGNNNIYFPHLKRGYHAMFKQILGALENSTADVIYLCEHDVLYPYTHFDFMPPRKDIFYYDHNWWRLRTTDGFAAHWDANQVSGLVAYREHLLQFYKKRVAEVEEHGYRNTMGFEPGQRSTVLTKSFKSSVPYVDIKHGYNLSKNRWSLKDFHDKSTAKGFTTADEIPGWGKTEKLIKKFN